MSIDDLEKMKLQKGKRYEIISLRKSRGNSSKNRTNLGTFKCIANFQRYILFEKENGLKESFNKNDLFTSRNFKVVEII